MESTNKRLNTSPQQQRIRKRPNVDVEQSRSETPSDGDQGPDSGVAVTTTSSNPLQNASETSGSTLTITSVTVEQLIKAGVLHREKHAKFLDEIEKQLRRCPEGLEWTVVDFLVNSTHRHRELIHDVISLQVARSQPYLEAGFYGCWSRYGYRIMSRLYMLQNRGQMVVPIFVPQFPVIWYKKQNERFELSQLEYRRGKISSVSRLISHDKASEYGGPAGRGGNHELDLASGTNVAVSDLVFYSTEDTIYNEFMERAKSTRIPDFCQVTSLLRVGKMNLVALATKVMFKRERFEAEAKYDLLNPEGYVTLLVEIKAAFEDASPNPNGEVQPTSRSDCYRLARAKGQTDQQAYHYFHKHPDAQTIGCILAFGTLYTFQEYERNATLLNANAHPPHDKDDFVPVEEQEAVRDQATVAEVEFHESLRDRSKMLHDKFQGCRVFIEMQADEGERFLYVIAENAERRFLDLRYMDPRSQ